MRTLKRFSSFAELKSHEGSQESSSIMLRRHEAFEQLMAFIRASLKRKCGSQGR